MNPNSEQMTPGELVQIIAGRPPWTPPPLATVVAPLTGPGHTYRRLPRQAATDQAEQPRRVSQKALRLAIAAARKTAARLPRYQRPT
jgi:hypothetical protein